MVEGSDGGTPNLWKIGFHQETTKMQEQNPHKSSRAFTNLINFRNSSLGHQQLGNGDWPLVRLRKPPDPLSLHTGRRCCWHPWGRSLHLALTTPHSFHPWLWGRAIRPHPGPNGAGKSGV